MRVRRGFGVLGTLCVISAIVVTSSPSPASFPGLNGVLAFTTGTIADEEIYSAQATAGAIATNLTQSSGTDQDADWSKDGKKVVFSSARDGGNNEIYMMDADGTNQVRITNDGPSTQHHDVEPSLSPDGTKVAWRTDRFGGPGTLDIAVADLTSPNEPVNITAGLGAVDFEPQWSPDGSKIAYTSNASGSLDIWVAYADGSGALPVNVTESLSYPDQDTTVSSDEVAADWSPTGQHLVFASQHETGNFELWRATWLGQDVVRLTDSPAMDRDPAWSPNGTTIAFASNRDGDNEIFTIPSSSVAETGGTQVTVNTINDIDPDWQPIPFTRRPDAMVKLASDASYVGNNVYNATGTKQARNVGARRGSTRTFVIRLQNDGNAVDSFKRTGGECVASTSFNVSYYEGLAGTRAIDASSFNNVPIGGSRYYRAVVRIPSGARVGGALACLKIHASRNDVAKKDAVKFRVTVSG